MTAVPSAPASWRLSLWSRSVGWVRTKDQGLLAAKRSVRAAVVMPLAFGVAHLLFPTSPQTGLFAAFGSFALLLLADFRGRPRTRFVSYLTLFLFGGCLIPLGTVVSTNKVAAVVAMATVAFAVLLGGIVSPLTASASTAAVLVFVLPVAVAQPAAAVGPRLLGWALAGAFCVPACMLVWPTPWQDNLRRRLSATLSAVGRLAAALAESAPDPAVRTSLEAELGRLRDQLRNSTYPPAGAAAGAVALATLMGRVEWVAGNCALIREIDRSPALGSIRQVMLQSAETLRLSAALISDGDGYPVDDSQLAEAVRESTRQLKTMIGAELDAEISGLTDPDGGSHRRTPYSRLAASLHPIVRAQGLALATEMVAEAALTAASPSTPGQRASRLVWQQLGPYFSFHSVWFRNAVRGAVGLALAVTVIEITNLEHGFWVVLGTLSVLRSNALGTGSTALRVVAGTAVGFVVGAAIMIAVAGHLVVLWVLFPFAVLVSGAAPSMISFAAGQAGFTVTVIILFNLIVPSGWIVGLTRIEDVAIGCAVSVVVGLLFWPRGASAVLGRALADAFVTSSGYLSDAVDRMTSKTRAIETAPGQRAANSAYLRLDDAFRQFLAERGAKVVPVETVARLFTGANRIRLAAYTLATAPYPASAPNQPELESVAIAGAVLRDSYAASHRWYEEFAEILADRRQSLDSPPAADQSLHEALQRAVGDARVRRRADQIHRTVQMLWAVELLEAQGQVQADLAKAADLFFRQRRRPHAI